jgi:hypothetical protein
LRSITYFANEHRGGEDHALDALDAPGHIDDIRHPSRICRVVVEIHTLEIGPSCHVHDVLGIESSNRFIECIAVENA